MTLLRILIAIIIIAAAAGIIIFTQTADEISLTAEQQDLLAQSCTEECHNNNSVLNTGLHGIHDGIGCMSCHDSDSLHDTHANAGCQDCHGSSEGLEAPTRAHNALQWMGIGVLAFLVAGLVFNFGISRLRLRSQSEKRSME